MRFCKATIRMFITATAIVATPILPKAAEQILTAEQIAYVLSTSKALGAQATKGVDLQSVTFEYNSARLTQQAERQLDELAKAMQFPFKNVPFTIGGHTDARGAADYNQRLSEQRAMSVRDHHEERHGFPDQQVKAVGFGKSKLLTALPPTDANQRRVEITLQR